MVQKLRTIRTHLTGGQIDALMIGRSDTAGYANGMAEAKNYMPYVHGGIRTRIGSELLATLAAKSRIVEFEFSSTQRYIFAFSDTKLEIFSQAGTLLQTINSCPWTAAMLFPDMRLSWTQSGDVMFVANNGFQTQIITRTGASTFTLTDFEFEDTTKGQPYLKFATDGSTLTLSGTSGSVTVTCTEARFVDNHIGTQLRVLDGTTVRYLDVTAVGSTSPQTTCTATCGSTFSGTGAFDEWKEYAFSAATAWPMTVCLHGSRMWIGGDQNHVFGSRVNRFYSFDNDDATDDDSVDKPIPSDQIHEIRHMISSDYLEIFTDKGVFYVAETDSSPITPSNFKIKPQQPFGSNYARPAVFDDATLFAQATGRSIREYLYDDLRKKYSADAISLLATDVVGDVTEIAAIYGVENRPEQFCACINADGTIALFHGVRAHKILAWYPWETEGSYHSIRSMGDNFFACVERDIDGTPTFFIEKMSADWQVDCGTKLTGTAASVWTGLTDYANTDVAVFNGNLYLDTYTVNGSGELDISPFSVTAIEVGFAFDTQFYDLPPESALPVGTTIGEKKRVARITLQLYETYGLTVSNRDLIVRSVTDDLSIEPEPFTGLKSFPLLGWSRSGQVRITRKEPVKHTILAYTKEILV